MTEWNGLPDDFMAPYLKMKALVEGLKTVDSRDPTKMGEVLRSLDSIGSLYWEYAHDIPETLTGVSEADSLAIVNMFLGKYAALREAEGQCFWQAECMMNTCRAYAIFMLALMEIWYGQFEPRESDGKP
jgi:hypothetical protein